MHRTAFHLLHYSFEATALRRWLRVRIFVQKKMVCIYVNYQILKCNKRVCISVLLARFDFTQGILERLDAGEIVIGDGGFVFALEKRGYVKAGPWTPEAAAEYPEAGMATTLATTYYYSA